MPAGRVRSSPIGGGEAWNVRANARRDAPKPGPSAPEGRAGPLGAILAIAAALAIFFGPAFGPARFTYRDTGRMHAPMKQWIAAQLAEGRLPEWNPYSGLGTPLIANAIDAVQHPFNVLLVLLPPGVALDAWILLSFAVAAAGAFVWARTLGLGHPACAVAALAFALSGPLVSSSDNVTYLTTYAALPWVFAAAHLFVTECGPLRLAGVGAASALCAAGGDPQAWGVATALLPAYAAVIGSSGGRNRAALRGAAAAAMAAVAAAPFVLPIVAWLPQSARAGGLDHLELARWNLHPRRLVELVVPGLFRGEVDDPVSPLFQALCGNETTPLPWFLSIYVGAAVVALAILGAMSDRRMRWLGAAATLLAWAALGPHAGFGQIAARLPLVGTFRFWEKLAIWIALVLAIAAAAGVDALLRRPRRGLVVAVGSAAVILVALALAAALAPEALARRAAAAPELGMQLAGNLARGAFHAGLILALLAVVAAARERGALARATPLLLGAVVAGDLLGGNGGAYVLGPAEPSSRPPLAMAAGEGARVLTPFTLREDRWPRLGRLASTWEWSRRTLAATWNVPLRIGSPHDYVGLREARWSRLRTEVQDGGRDVARLGLFGFGLLVVPGSPDLAARAGVPAPARVLAEDPELPAWLIELPHRPRAYVAQEVTNTDADGAFAFAASGGMGSRLTVVEGPVSGPASPGRGVVRIVRDDPGATDLEVAVAERSLVVLNDAWSPGWRAHVDDGTASIERVNWVVRGVWVDAGEHRIRFRYRTPGLREGWALALIAAAGLGAWAGARRWSAGRARARLPNAQV